MPNDETADKLIDKLIEECAELTLILIRSRQFGLARPHPNKPERLNWKEVLHEIEDVEKQCKMLKEHILKGERPCSISLITPTR